MTKIIIIFGLVLFLFAGFVFYQFAKPVSPKQVTVNNQTFSVEVAKSAKQQQVGLTKYDSLAQDKGMLFQFSQPAHYSFWMKNMKFPIDIIFLKENTVVEVIASAPVQPASKSDIPIYGEDITSDAVLEINAGLAEKYGIKQGDKLILK